MAGNATPPRVRSREAAPILRHTAFALDREERKRPYSITESLGDEARVIFSGSRRGMAAPFGVEALGCHTG